LFQQKTSIMDEERAPKGPKIVPVSLILFSEKNQWNRFVCSLG